MSDTTSPANWSTSLTDGRLTPRYAWRQPLKAARQWLAQARFGRDELSRDLRVVPKEVAEVLERLAESPQGKKDDNLYSYGGHLQSQRVAALAELAVSLHPGDIVEIGVNRGFTTMLLAPIAARHGRKVIAVDPWIAGTQNCQGFEFEEFMRNTAPWRDAVEIWKMSSFAPEAFDRMGGRPLAFAFVDGLHTFDACMSDFRLVGHAAGLIAADDVRYNREVALALRISARRLARRAFHLPTMREGYLLPC